MLIYLEVRVCCVFLVMLSLLQAPDAKDEARPYVHRSMKVNGGKETSWFVAHLISERQRQLVDEEQRHCSMRELDVQMVELCCKVLQ
jgi:hypothetical protein